MRRTALLASALFAALATPALAHQGNPNFESLVTRIDGAPGVRAEMLNGDDRLLIVNAGEQTVVVEGYDDEPYARIKPHGAVEVNQRSPAAYLNDDRFGQVKLPPQADKNAAPVWKQVGQNGRFEFHDHRAHYMATGTPPQVKDDTKKSKVFTWVVPLQVSGRPAAVHGTLWWRGTGGGAPGGAFVGLGLFALLSLTFVVAVRRGRRQVATGGDAGETREVW